VYEEDSSHEANMKNFGKISPLFFKEERVEENGEI